MRRSVALSPLDHAVAVAATVIVMVMAALSFAPGGWFDDGNGSESSAAGTAPDGSVSTPPESATVPPPATSSPVDAGSATVDSSVTSTGNADVDATAAPTTELQASLAPIPPTLGGSVDDPVIEIRTVPAVAGLVIDVDGRLMMTDADGVLGLGEPDASATVGVVGPSAGGADRAVTVLQWSDGSTEVRRSLANVDDPVIDLALEIRDRIVLELDDRLDRVDSVLLSSPQVGRIEVRVDEPTWVISTRGVLVDGEISEEAVVYGVDPADNPVGKGLFVPEPGAVWRVTP